MPLLCPALVALFPASVGAETIDGVVRDAATGRPIAGGVVRAGARDAAPAVYTDSHGRFALSRPGQVTQVQVIAAGYRAKTISLSTAASAAGPVVVRLAQQDDSQGEVIEVSGRVPEGARVPTYDLSSEELTAIPGAGNDSLKALQSLPGVARVPFGLGGLILRGTSPRDTNVFIDGVEVPLLYHFGGLSSVYPSALLESVELAPGGFGAAWGRARGGLVTARSRPGRGDQWRSAGEASLIDASVRADGPAAGGTWSLSLRRSYVDAVLRTVLPADSVLQLTLAPRYYDGQLRYDLVPTANDELSLFLFGSDDRLALAVEDDGGGNFEENQPGSFSFGTSFVRLAAQWRRFADDTSITATAWTGFDKSQIWAGQLGQTRTMYPVGLRASLTRFTALGEVTAGVAIDAGRYDLNLRNQPPPMPGVDDPREVVNQSSQWATDVGAWVETLIKMGEGGLALRPGLRLDHYGLTGEWIFDPRITASHELPANLTLSESFGLYHQPPIPADFDYGTPEIKSSWAVQASVGLAGLLPAGIQASITAFSQDSHRIPVDAVSAASPVAGGGSVNSGGAGAASAEVLYEQFGRWGYLDDVGSGRSHGIELLLKRATERFFAWLSYTRSRSLRRDDPTRFPTYHPYVLDQPHLLTALASVKLGKNWRFGGRLRYATGNPYTPVDSVYLDADTQRYMPIDGALLSTRLPSFFQLDARIDRIWDRPWGRLSLFLDVQNVTNRVNAEGVTYSYDYGETQYTRGLPVFPSLGLTFQQ